jgi:indolepyruvate ferredoxin oxidoreductase beta subunit
LLRSAWARPLADRLTRSGRVVKTTSVSGFLLLRAIAMLKPLRRRSLRFAREQASLAEWLQALARTVSHDPELALEIAQARGLVKGYGDMRAWPALAGRHEAAAKFATLRKAALADEDGTALRSALADQSDGAERCGGTTGARPIPYVAIG